MFLDYRIKNDIIQRIIKLESLLTVTDRFKNNCLDYALLFDCPQNVFDLLVTTNRSYVGITHTLPVKTKILSAYEYNILCSRSSKQIISYSYDITRVLHNISSGDFPEPLEQLLECNNTIINILNQQKSIIRLVHSKKLTIDIFRLLKEYLIS
jgi:hypothetical protein